MKIVDGQGKKSFIQHKKKIHSTDLGSFILAVIRSTIYQILKLKHWNFLKRRSLLIRNVAKTTSQNPSIPRVNWWSKGETTFLTHNIVTFDPIHEVKITHFIIICSSNRYCSIPKKKRFSKWYPIFKRWLKLVNTVGWGHFE